MSYGSGAGNEIGFGLYIPFKCRIDRMVMQSVFGANEVTTPQFSILIQILKNNETILSYPFPSNSMEHTGLTDEEFSLDIPVAGCTIYIYSSGSNLIDEDARHRITFYFKQNYLQN